MKRLIEFRVRIPGEWMDVWLYKGSVLLWSPDGEIRWLSIAEIEAEIGNATGPSARLIADYLIFRNDWKVGEQFHLLRRSPHVLSALLGEVTGASNSVDFISSLRPAPIPSRERFSGYLLDIAVTGNRIFSATTNGLFETEFNPDFPDTGSDVVRNVEGRVNSVAVNGGRAAIAMDEMGRRTGQIEYGGGSEWASNCTQFTEIADYSLNASYSSYNLLNYRGEAAPDFLRASKRQEPATGAQSFPRTVIDAHDAAISIFEPLSEVVRSAADARSLVRIEDLHVVGNSNYKLLVTDGAEYASVINLGWGSVAERRGIAPNRNFSRAVIDGRAVADAFSTQEIKSGFVIEGYDYSSLLTENGLYPITNSPVLRTRTFPRSRRHADTFAVVANDFVQLVGFLEVDE